MNLEHGRTLRHNLVVNLLDGAFFGFALGAASFVTVIPLFVRTMTDSAILIGLVPAIHSVGWQLPQLLIAGRVARQSRYKPMMLVMTVHERLPFLGLALVALFAPGLDRRAALLLTFLLLVWQGLGGGFTAASWQSMIAKIFPADRHGTFYGAQSAVANLLASLGAVLAGFLLDRLNSPADFVWCFLLASVSMAISWTFLAMTREAESPPASLSADPGEFWSGLGQILRRDRNFCWFLAARMLSQVAIVGAAFYSVYAVHRLGMSEAAVGGMTAVLMGTQIAATPLMGWLGDRWGHRLLMEAGMLCASAGALLAWLAPGPAWFYLIFALAGIAHASVWTISLAMILQFGCESERPAYIGLANTLTAPATFLAPLLGGWLAELAGYPSTFLASALGGLLTAAVLHWLVRDPRRLRPAPAPQDISVQIDQQP